DQRDAHIDGEIRHALNFLGLGGRFLLLGRFVLLLGNSDGTDVSLRTSGFRSLVLGAWLLALTLRTLILRVLALRTGGLALHNAWWDNKQCRDDYRRPNRSVISGNLPGTEFR